MHGPGKVTTFLERHRKGSRLKYIEVDDSTSYAKPKSAAIDLDGEVRGIVAWLNIQTDVGTGKGIVRLLRDAEDGAWKAFTLFTAMREITGHAETIKHIRPSGGLDNVPGERKNWHEMRIAQENFQNGLEPTVLVIGTLPQ